MIIENIIRYGLILQLQAEIEAMKVANFERELKGESLAYGEKAFREKADAFHNIIYCPNDEL